MDKMGLVDLGNGKYRKKTKAELNGSLIEKKPSSREKLFAKGRLASGEMNKTERAYQKHLEALKFTGKISWYLFEGITLRLAKLTTIKPDFAVMLPDGELQLHDVKGHRAIYQDDAKAKMKIAAELFPFRLFVVFPRTEKVGGGWDIEEVNQQSTIQS